MLYDCELYPGFKHLQTYKTKLPYECFYFQPVNKLIKMEYFF